MKDLAYKRRAASYLIYDKRNIEMHPFLQILVNVTDQSSTLGNLITGFFIPKSWDTENLEIPLWPKRMMDFILGAIQRP
jgi:hypothetical protein